MVRDFPCRCRNRSPPTLGSEFGNASGHLVICSRGRWTPQCSPALDSNGVEGRGVETKPAPSALSGVRSVGQAVVVASSSFSIIAAVRSRAWRYLLTLSSSGVPVTIFLGKAG